MKRISGLITFLALTINGYDQFVIYDSVATSSQNRDMTFYNLQTGYKTVVSNNDWHLAVSVRPSLFPNNTLQGTTFRINEAFGVKVYSIPGFTADSFNVVVDTVNALLQELHDSDSLLDFGSLNTGLNIGVFNYGWGVYSGPPNHNVEGNKIFLMQLPNREVKKLLIQDLARDTAWNIKYANIDNSDLQLVHIGKKDYQGKNFVYLNLLNNQVMDKEPLSAEWDLQFLKYSATDIIAGKTIPEVGVWVNKGDSVAERRSVDVADTSYSGLTFSGDMNTIGWDWKHYINYQSLLAGKNLELSSNFYQVEDSLTYFIRTVSHDVYKVVFTAYKGPSSGDIYFNKENLTSPASGIAGADDYDEVVIVFPNPVNDRLNVIGNPDAKVEVYDLGGQFVVATVSGNNVTQLNVSSLESGMYVLSVTSDKRKMVNKFTVSHH